MGSLCELTRMAPPGRHSAPWLRTLGYQSGVFGRGWRCSRRLASSYASEGSAGPGKGRLTDNIGLALKRKFDLTASDVREAKATVLRSYNRTPCSA